MFFRASLRTIRTLRSPHFLALLVKTALLTLLAFAAFILLAGVATRSFTFFADSTTEWLSDIALTFGIGFIGWLLLPTLLPAIAAFFQEPIADAIERADYPEFTPPAVQRPWYVELWEEGKFALLLIFLNILFLPFLFFPVIYFVLNGYLIGREFFETAAARHIGKQEARRLRRENRMAALLGGMVIVGLALIPLVQLSAPFIGVALMVHLFHLLPKDEEILRPARDSGTASPHKPPASSHAAQQGKRFPEKYRHVTGRKKP